MLPIVKPDITGSILHEVNAAKDKFYLLEQLNKIATTNPCVAAFIANFSGEGEPSPEDIAFRAACGIMVYRLLESQAEADDLL